MNPVETTADINFAYKIRHALNKHVDTLPPATLDRLALARRAAMAVKKKNSPSIAWVPRSTIANSSRIFIEQPFSWLGRIGVVAPLVLGVAMFIGIYHTTQEQRIKELADVDIAVLSDELTLLAYLDTGFNAYLARRGE